MSKNTRYLLFYIITVGGLLAVLYAVLESVPASAIKPTPAFHPGSLLQMASSGLREPLAILLIQIILILATAKVCGRLAVRLAQPAVVGEIFAGIALGPSLFRNLAPAAAAGVFPTASLPQLQALSGLGLVLFMFIVGMELDRGLLRGKTGALILISHASIVIPYALGVSTALVLYDDYAPPGIPFRAFALFMGIAMSVTAFPVLARILRERGLTHTRLGGLALSAAAADDVTAWCVLAAIIAYVKAGSALGALLTIGAAAAFIALMLVVVKPALARICRRWMEQGGLAPSRIAVLLLTMLISAWVCEAIGIHALFGAFLGGVVMPEALHLRQALTAKLESVTTVLLLPIFFVHTGLRTDIGLLHGAEDWGVCLAVTGVAVAGKAGGGFLAARVTGEKLRDALAIGALMNTRGLMELVVLNIGYGLGILSPKIFTVMVIMALATTMMTGPALALLHRGRGSKRSGDAK